MTHNDSCASLDYDRLKYDPDNPETPIKAECDCAPDRLKPIELFAWVGEDELGSGVIGLKQGLVPAGYISLVATEREKVDRPVLRLAESLQAKDYGKKIYLCRFKFDAVLWETEEGEAL